MTSLYQIQSGDLVQARSKPLARESLIEGWVAKDPSLIGLDVIIIGQQVPTEHGKFIDLLAMERDGSLVIIELKKDKTPREVVAQVLDYASWVRTLSSREIHERAEHHLQKRLSLVYQEYFGERIPEQLNASHSMLIVASELDPASRRIVEYLFEEHSLNINTVFFKVFEADGKEWLTTDFLLDQKEVSERSERKVRAPWSGYYFVNAGLGDERAWSDMKKYGFIGACGGDFYTKRLKQLSLGDKFFVYDKGQGYIGFGVVTHEVGPASEFMTSQGLLFEQQLESLKIKHNADDLSLAEFVVGVNWLKTFSSEDAKSFKGIFANQNIVCKLRDEATVEFLMSEFQVSAFEDL